MGGEFRVLVVGFYCRLKFVMSVDAVGHTQSEPMHFGDC